MVDVTEVTRVFTKNIAKNLVAYAEVELQQQARVHHRLVVMPVLEANVTSIILQFVLILTGSVIPVDVMASIRLYFPNYARKKDK